MKIKTKLTLWYTSMLIIIIITFSMFIYFFMLKVIHNSEINLIKDYSADIIYNIDIDNRKIKFTESHELISSGTYVIIYSNNKKIIFESNKSFTHFVNKIPYSTAIREISYNNNEWLIYDQPFYYNNNLIGWVRIGRPSLLKQTLENLKIVILFSIPFPILISVLGGLFLATRALAPIDYITKTARTIGQGDLRQRLNMPKIEDEVGRLALTFDEMLDKLELAFKKEKQFTADASHELRTPITVIKAQIEEALANSRSDINEYKEILNTIFKETTKMNRIISQLLFLTRYDNGNNDIEIENIDLKVIIEDVIDTMKEIAAQNKVNLRMNCNNSVIIKGDQTLITRLFINLIDNAIKYNKIGGWVNVVVIEEQNKVKIIVEDNGIGIPKEDIPYIFNRFYRVDKSRSSEGTGLGLSIVEWIVKIHKGDITVNSQLGIGTRFEITLPL
ncbi:sensor histidine kinase [Caldicellulosiruptoraceae bacterium PP1]